MLSIALEDEHLLAAIAFCGVLLVIVMGPCVAMVGLYRKYFRGRLQLSISCSTQLDGCEMATSLLHG